MKVALCYRGHYYREYLHKNSNKKNNLGSSFFLNYENHKSNILDCFENVDVYIHTYSVNADLDKSLIDLVKPTCYMIDKQLKQEIRHSIIQVNKMYNENDYDFIINTRFDLQFKQKITNFNLDFNKFNFLWRERVKKKKLLPDFRCSDLLWAFHPKYKKNFEDAYGDRYDKFFGNINPMRDGHTILKLLTDVISIDEVNFTTNIRYTSDLSVCNPFLTINRAFK